MIYYCSEENTVLNKDRQFHKKNKTCIYKLKKTMLYLSQGLYTLLKLLALILIGALPENSGAFHDSKTPVNKHNQ